MPWRDYLACEAVYFIADWTPGCYALLNPFILSCILLSFALGMVMLNTSHLLKILVIYKLGKIKPSRSN